MRKLTQRTEAVVNLRALEHNVKNIRARLGSGVEIMAVLKGDGYGHGEKGIYPTLKSCGIERYAVAVWEEGASLRNAGCTEPILLLGDTCDGQLENLIKFNLTPAIFSLDTAEKLNTLAKWGGVTQPVHIKIDTGMSRIGFPADESAVESVRRISEMSNLEITGAFTHFSRADEPDGASAKAQFEKYIRFIEQLEDAGIHIPMKHVANSPAILLRPEVQLDAVRAGDALFGLCPIDEDDWKNEDFMQVMNWYTYVVMVKSSWSKRFPSAQRSATAAPSSPNAPQKSRRFPWASRTDTAASSRTRVRSGSTARKRRLSDVSAWISSWST